MQYRLFIAIHLPENVLDILEEYSVKYNYLPVRWTKRENLHLTILFLGNTEENLIPRLKKQLLSVGERHSSFILNIKRLLVGPPRGMPRMVWAEIQCSEPLISLYRDIALTLKCPVQHLSPHLTLARMGRNGRLSRGDADEQINLEMEVKSFELMQSELTPKGPVYTELLSVSLL